LVVDATHPGGINDMGQGLGNELNDNKLDKKNWHEKEGMLMNLRTIVYNLIKRL
jgi:hypothetical protein